MPRELFTRRLTRDQTSLEAVQFDKRDEEPTWSTERLLKELSRCVVAGKALTKARRYEALHGNPGENKQIHKTQNKLPLTTTSANTSMRRQSDAARPCHVNVKVWQTTKDAPRSQDFHDDRSLSTPLSTTTASSSTQRRRDEASLCHVDVDVWQTTKDAPHRSLTTSPSTTTASTFTHRRSDEASWRHVDVKVWQNTSATPRSQDLRDDRSLTTSSTTTTSALMHRHRNKTGSLHVHGKTSHQSSALSPKTRGRRPDSLERLPQRPRSRNRRGTNTPRRSLREIAKHSLVTR